MRAVRRGWGRFRRLPAAARLATAVGVTALYTVAIVAVVTGGDDRRTARAGGQPDEQRAGERRGPMTAEERQVKTIFGQARPAVHEDDDVPELRRVVLQRVRCAGGACRIRYTIGVPGMGLILEQQRRLLQRILRETSLARVTFDVRREKSLRQAGDPSPAEEETTSGTALFTLRCDRARARELDPRTTSAEELLARLCTLRAADMGAQQSTSAARQGRGQGGDGILEQVPAG